MLPQLQHPLKTGFQEGFLKGAQRNRSIARSRSSKWLQLLRHREHQRHTGSWNRADKLFFIIIIMILSLKKIYMYTNSKSGSHLVRAAFINFHIRQWPEDKSPALIGADELCHCQDMETTDSRLSHWKMWSSYIFINKSSSGLCPGFIDRFKLLIVSGKKQNKKHWLRTGTNASKLMIPKYQ